MRTYTAYILFPYKKKRRSLVKWPIKEVFQEMAASDNYSVEEIDVEADSYKDACNLVLEKLYKEYEKAFEAIYLEERLPEVQIWSMK